MNRTLAARTCSTLLVVAASLAVVTAAADAQNLIPNASFDHDATGWDPLDPTIVVAHRPDDGSDLAGGSGPGCLEVRHFFWNGSLGGPLHVVDEVTPSATYRLEASYLLPTDDNVADSVALFLDWIGENGFSIQTDSIEAWPLVEDAWTRLSGEFAAPAGAVSAVLRLMVGNPVLSGETRPGVARFDDVWLSQAGVDTATQALFVPGAASAHGVGGTFWSTTGWFSSLVDVPVTVRGAFLTQDGDNSSALGALTDLGVVPPRGYLEVPDLVGALGGVEAAGGIYLEATADGGNLPATLVAATTHTFTPNPTGDGVYGQGLPAVGAGERNEVVVPGLYQGARFRTNVGVLSTSDETVSVDIVVRGSDGAVVASATWVLQPYQHRQRSLASLGAGGLDGGTVEITRTSAGGSFRAYTSTVDQSSGDAVYNAAR